MSEFLNGVEQNLGGGGVRGLTQDEIDKLAGIDVGAQVNPKNVELFAGEDSNTDADGGNLLDGAIGFFASGSQVVSGDVAQTDTIFLPLNAAAYGSDATQPLADLAATSIISLMDDTVDNGGNLLLYVLPYPDSTKHLYVESTTIEKVVDGGIHKGYKLTNLTWHGNYTPASYGISWNIAIDRDTLNFSKNIVDLQSRLSAFVTKVALEGHVNDEFASYDNALFGSNYFPGNFCLFNQSTQPTDDTNAIRQPDIVSGSGVIVFGDLRDDSDPTKAFTPEAVVAADYPSGRVIHISAWSPYKPDTYLTLTLTSAATKVGTGNGEHLWATASWVETGNVGDVVDDGDYFRFSENVPSGLDLDLPWESIANPPWVNNDGKNVSDAVISAIQGKNEAKTLDDTFRVDVSNVSRYISITNTNQQKNIRIRIPSSDTENDDDLKRLLLKRAWVRIGDWFVDITTNVTRAAIGTSITYSFDFAVLKGTQPTGSTPVHIRVIGEDVHRGEIILAALENEHPNLAGNSAVNGQVWKFKENVAKWYDDLEWTIDEDLPAAPLNGQRHTFTDESIEKLSVDSKEKTGQTNFGFFSNVATSIIYSNSGAGVGGTRSFVMGYNSGDDVSEYTGMVAGDELWVIDTTNGTTTKLILTGAPGTATYGSGGNNRPGVYWATANLQSPPASNWMTAGRAYDVVAVKPTKVIPLDTFDYRDGKWTKVFNGGYQRDVLDTVFPDNPVKGQRLIVKANASTHLTASLGKFTKSGEATAAQFAAGDIAWVNLQGYNGIHIGFETTDDYQVFLDLTSGDEVGIIDDTTNATILTLNLTGAFQTYTFNSKPVVVIVNSNYNNTISANPFTDERSYSVYPIEDHPTVKDEIWKWDGHYWVKEYSPDGLGEVWVNLYTSSGVNGVQTFNLDSGKKFSDYSMLEIEYSNIQSGDYLTSEEIALDRFKSKKVFLSILSQWLKVEYEGDTSFSIDGRSGSSGCYLHNIRGKR